MLFVLGAHGYLTDLLLVSETHTLPSSVAPDRSAARTAASTALLLFHRGQSLGLSGVASLCDLTASMVLVFNAPKDQQSRDEQAMIPPLPDSLDAATAPHFHLDPRPQAEGLQWRIMR